jgi:hypothetical protein
MFKRSFLSIAVIGAGLLGFSAMPASAMPVTAQPVAQTGSADLMVEVNHRRTHRDRIVRYDRNRHGPRCSRWSRNCGHFYRGYYYGSPWWTLPLVGSTVVIGSSPRYYSGRRAGSRHVQWCLDHYRSYNVRTNTWISYDGDVRQCRSPYRG